MNKLIPATLSSLLATASPTIAQDTLWSGADEYYGTKEMEKSRQAVITANGGMNVLFFEADKLEYRSNENSPLLVWDMQGWYGSDLNKLWIKTEGEYSFDHNQFEHGEVQALYSRAISPFFDLQMGLKHDITPNPSTTYGVIGLHGLAPYWFEVDAALFISDNGDVSSKFKAEYELNFTQKLILQPQIEVKFNFQDIEGTHEAAGFSKLEAGLRLRYEITRKFAPYVGMGWDRKLGGTATLARDDGEDPSKLNFIIGLKSWF